jgi:signal peptidase II
MVAEEGTHSSHETAEKPAVGATPGQWLFLLGVAVLVIVADQIAKAYVSAHLALYSSWMPLHFLEPVFRFTHVHNTGAAFGLFPEGGSIFLVIAVIISSFIIYFYRQLPAEAWLVRLALGLQLGGALGNVIDRVHRGYVIDFMHLEHWPVFNVADSCIVLGVVLLALEMLIEEYQAARDAKDTET